jgi:gliding motility-associated-like protein
MLLEVPLLAHIPDTSQSALEFVENKGQFHPLCRYKASIPYGNLYLENTGWCMVLLDTQEYHQNKQFRHDFPTLQNPHKVTGTALRFKLNGVDRKPRIKALHKLPHYYNYFYGRQRISKVHPNKECHYKEIEVGVDLEVSLNHSLKYQWVVHQPNPEKLEGLGFSIEGASSLTLVDGNLVIETPHATLIDKAPFAYQMVNGKKRVVQCSYTLSGNQVGFQFREDVLPGIPLVVDPELIFSTYSGSVGDNFGYTATYDSRGNFYAGGIVDARGPYPVTAGAYDLSYNGGIGTFPVNLPCDIAISKYDSSGSQLLWATYLGGSVDEYPHSLVVDANDDLVMLGTSTSADYPFTKTAFDTTHAGGTDIVVTKMSGDGTSLLGSTFIGGNRNDGLNQSSLLRHNYADDFRGDIIPDDDLNIYVATCTLSDSLPTVDSIQQTNNGNTDGYLFELSPNCEELIWATYLGGVAADALYSIKLDEENIYFGGGTASRDLPTTEGVLEENRVGGVDGLVGYFNRETKKLGRLSYWGTPSYDQVYFIDIDAQSRIYATGQTEGSIKKSVNTYGSDDKGQFIWRADTNLNQLDFITTFGNADNKINLAPSAFLVDVCEHIYFSGWGADVDPRLNPGSTNNLEVTSDAEQSVTDGNDFYIMVLDNDASALLYATYFGGDVTDDHVDGGTSRFDKRGVIYQSVCSSCPPSRDGQNTQVSDFPTSANAVYKTNPSVRCSNASLKIDLQIETNVLADFVATPTIACTPVEVTFFNKSILGDSMFWDFGDGVTSTELNPKHTYEEPGEYIVSLTVIDSNSCNISSTTEQLITVLDTGTAAFQATYDACLGTLTLENFSDNALDYLWEFGNGDTSEDELPEYSYPTPGEYWIKLKVNPGSLCESVDSQLVNIAAFAVPEITLYNVFTPDNDGKNDCFQMDLANAACGEYELKIFNRWGEKVFETEDAIDCWNGKLFNTGKELPASTYFYMVKYGETIKTAEPISGIVEMIR